MRIANDHTQVKNVPEWFPGAGFRRFAREGRKMFNVAVDGPLEWVKESLKVSPRGSREYFDSRADCKGKSNGSNASVASSCFDRVVELQGQGFDESDIRMMTSTTYIGGISNICGDRTARPD